MLGKNALYYHAQGMNCSQSIILACEKCYNIKMCENCKRLFVTCSNGFGIGGMCSVLIACVMFFGVYYKDEETARQAGLTFLDRFMHGLCSLDCCRLKKASGSCEKVICLACDITEDIISHK